MCSILASGTVHTSGVNTQDRGSIFLVEGGASCASLLCTDHSRVCLGLRCTRLIAIEDVNVLVLGNTVDRLADVTETRT